MASVKNLLDGYVASDQDQTNQTTQYYGFIDGRGNWYIIQQNGTGPITYRYATGGGGSAVYATNWGNRATLNYDYYSNVFANL